MAIFRIAALDKPSAEELAVVRSIFQEYANSLSVNLCFQGFDQELAALPGVYGEPRGVLVLAHVGAEVAGCGALRPADETDYANAAEMKRLYVRPTFRRLGIGRALSERILELARAKGYASVLLDTLSEMEMARALYDDLGFEEIPPYYHNPIPGAHYLRAVL